MDVNRTVSLLELYKIYWPQKQSAARQTQVGISHTSVSTARVKCLCSSLSASASIYNLTETHAVLSLYIRLCPALVCI